MGSTMAIRIPSRAIVGFSLLVGCGPSTADDGEGGTSSATVVSANTTGNDGDSASSTTSTECADVHEGDLLIEAGTDVSSFEQIGRVTGDLVVYRTDYVDLAFLGCLKEVEGSIRIWSNDRLATLEGLDRLELVGHGLEFAPGYIGGALSVIGCNSLTSLDGIGPVENLFSVTVVHNEALTDLALNDLETLYALNVGECVPDERALRDDDALVEINGLAKLTGVQEVTVGGQHDLVSLGRIRELAASGGYPGFAANFYNNRNLPYSEIEAITAVTGIVPSAACGNLGDPVPDCDPVGACGID